MVQNLGFRAPSKNHHGFVLFNEREFFVKFKLTHYLTQKCSEFFYETQGTKPFQVLTEC